MGKNQQDLYNKVLNKFGEVFMLNRAVVLPLSKQIVYDGEKAVSMRMEYCTRYAKIKTMIPDIVKLADEDPRATIVCNNDTRLVVRINF